MSTKKGKWTRRAFMVTGGLLGGGLVVGVAGMAHVNRKIEEYTGRGLGEGASLNAWIRIAPDNSITLAVPRAEMGQGVYTSLPMLVAEELEVDMASVSVIHPQPERPYANIFMVSQAEPNAYEGYSFVQKMFAFMNIVATGGSASIPDGFTNLRYAGATAREMLKRAAANRWGITVDECEAKQGFVVNTVSGEQFTYGSLAEEAAAIELAGLPLLKEKKDWKILGKPMRRLDVPEKVTGEGLYGIDVREDNLLYAVVRFPSVVGGRVVAVENKDEIASMPGVKGIVRTDDGVAVVADNTWRAKNAVLSLQLEEDDAGNSTLSSEQVTASLNMLASQPDSTAVEEEGDVDAVFQERPGALLESKYELPYLAHAAMEPLNCTVLVEDNSVDIWVGHQAPSIVLDVVNGMTGVEKEQITIHTPFLGGGFGRRGESDFVRIATAVAQSMKGTPVMSVYMRETDMQHDFYRPGAVSVFKAVVESGGEIAAWENRIASQPVGYEAMSRLNAGMPLSPDGDGASTEGARHLPYIMKNRRVSFNYLDSPLPVGFWRSVGSSTNAFFTECFMDECAHAANIDPYQFRRSKLGGHPRYVAVIDKVAEMSNWGEGLRDGRFHGIALHKSFGSIVGQVAEITQTGDKSFSIDKYYCAIDCGTYISPDIIESQMAGGIIFGLSAALYGEITWKDGQVQQVNFPQYEMVKMRVAPEVEVHIIEIDEYPGGVGEPGTPPAAPALANALFAATGEPVRSLPLVKHGYTFV